MAMVIRTLYNNQDWSGPCIRPGEDPNCSCFTAWRAIGRPSLDDEICSGHCWERYICTRYRWGCTPPGNTFNRAYVGSKVFLVFSQRDGLYTLWGVTKVMGTDGQPRQEGGEDEKGFAFVHFEPFTPLPKDKWVRDLRDLDLVGASWRMGTFRYISTQQESYLESLLQGHRPESQPSTYVNFTLKIMGHIDEKLNRIASMEGREKEDLIRQAIAEFVNARLSPLR